ncbi:hypothetical protein ACVW1C_000204 [Bradyrhizobium sp. USDA 4011]
MTETAPICCGAATRLTTGSEIYPHRRNLHWKHFYKCDHCKSYCGCHPGTTKSLGTPANAATRAARSNLHDNVFDPIWKGALASGQYAPEDHQAENKIKKAARSRLYRYLAHHLGIDRDACHFGMFTLEQCKRATEILTGLTYRAVRDWHYAQVKQNSKAETTHG